MPLSAIKPDQYDTLLADKVAAVSHLIAPFSTLTPQIFPSATTGFRLRAEFRVWHEGDDLNYVMFRRGEPKNPVVITDFPIACEDIQRLMPGLLDCLRQSDTLRRKLFQVEFLATLTGEMLVTLAYHRKLDEQWQAQAEALVTELAGQWHGLSVVGRSRKQKLVIGNDYVREELPVLGELFSYLQYEQSFTQPNGRINIRMIEWACQQASGASGDLLELYCGNGNFTLPLSRYFDTVIATELSKSSVRAARANLAANHVDNVHLIRLAAEEVTQAMNKVREFRRLKDLPRALDEFALHTLFVDPPRAGLDEHTLAMAGRFATIIYISCNPATLAENLLVLCQTHRITAFAMFDQFPYTDHMECGVVLQAIP